MITIEESIRRLTILRNHLVTQVPTERFDMSIWAMVDKVENQPDLLSAETFSQGGCGTAACALGHAAMIPEFQDLGLVAEKYNSMSQSPNNAYLVYYDNRGGIYGAAVFFGIGSGNSSRIFAPAIEHRGNTNKLSNVTMETVIANIDFVLDYQRSKLDEPISDVIPPYFGAPL